MSTTGGDLTPAKALAQLKAGNERFAKGRRTYPRQDAARRAEVAERGQHPLAVVVCCSDARCPPELLFDQGIGDLFVVRVAGNVCGPETAGSVEYGVMHTRAPLCVVLGHTHCGAIAAVADGARLETGIRRLLRPVSLALSQARAELPTRRLPELVARATRLNVLQSLEDLLRGSGEIRRLVAQRRVLLVGAVYDIRTGSVSWLGEHPRQAEML